MVVTFVFCQFFPIVGDVYELICLLEGNSTEGICESNIHIENCINFGHFMLMVNSSVNFIFYMTNIVKFREEFLKVYDSVLFLINTNIFIFKLNIKHWLRNILNIILGILSLFSLVLSNTKGRCSKKRLLEISGK